MPCASSASVGRRRRRGRSRCSPRPAAPGTSSMQKQIAADAGHVRLDHASTATRGDRRVGRVPPARSVSIAASIASGCEVAAMPSQAMTGERPGQLKVAAHVQWFMCCADGPRFESYPARHSEHDLRSRRTTRRRSPVITSTKPPRSAREGRCRRLRHQRDSPPCDEQHECGTWSMAPLLPSRAAWHLGSTSLQSPKGDSSLTETRSATSMP